MRLLFVQLSDLHCRRDDYCLEEKIQKAVTAIDTLGKVDGAVLVVSGDLSDTATQAEFRVVKKIVGTFLHDLSEALNCGFIDTWIVPGNHDIILPDESRGANDIKKWNKKEHLPEELERLKNYFEYSSTKYCFSKDKICDVRTKRIGNVNVQFCLLNSAPYSTRDPVDKQFHYLPAYVSKMLARDPEVNLKITVMHHHYEWFEWGSKEILKNALKTDDIVFFGHDHSPESLTMVNGDGSTYNIIMGGKFNLELDQDSSFNAVIYDSRTHEIYRYEFNWSINERLFTAEPRGKINKKKKALTPTEQFIDGLLKDNQNIGTRITDYYVLPKFVVEGDAFSSEEHAKCNSVDDIFAALNADKVIRITGGNGSGKTTLLRYLYCQSIEHGYMPLLIENKDYRDSKIDKMFRDLFEEQYGTILKHGYDAYEQADQSKQIVFVDDLDLIVNSKAQENLVAKIIESGRLLLYTTKEKSTDLEKMVKDKLQGKATSTIEIKPFYKETRDKLIEKVCKVYGKGLNEKEVITDALDYMVQCQTCFFTFTPTNMLQYIKYFLQGRSGNRKNIQTIAMVFETNIRNAILSCEKDHVANVYLMVLEYIADQMYFVYKIDKVTLAELEGIIKKFTSARKADINAKQFLASCVQAQILKEDDASFNVSFFDNNTFAYFVAKSISREFEKSQANTEKLLYVMDRICFGINDTIIMFLSFIRSNTNIILKIAEDSIKLMEKFPEWDFEAMNVPFLHQYAEMSDKVPTSQDKKNAHKHAEQVEKERHDVIKYRGIFDYDEAEINAERYVILRALKYSQLIGRALIDQYGALDADELDKLLEALFSVPQKVIYAILKPNQDHIEDIVRNIIKFIKEKSPDVDIKEDYIKKLLGQVGTVVALNIMNDIAFNATNENTIIALREGPLDNTNHKIMLLMMEENTGNTIEFVSKAIDLWEEYNSNHYAQRLITQIARKHIIYKENIDYKQIDKLVSKKIVSSNSRAELLLEHSSKSKEN